MNKTKESEIQKGFHKKVLPCGCVQKYNGYIRLKTKYCDEHSGPVYIGS